MAQSPRAAAPDPELAEAAANLTRWRATRPAGERIPEALWSRAVELASCHGVAQVARALRLDYVRLNRWLATTSEVTAPPPPAFLDRTLDLAPAGSSCVLALSDARGRSLRIEWTRGGGQRGRGGGAQSLGGPCMIALTPQLRVLVAVAPADFRCGIDGLE